MNWGTAGFGSGGIMLWVFSALGALFLLLIGGIALFVYFPDHDPYHARNRERDYS